VKKTCWLTCLALVPSDLSRLIKKNTKHEGHVKGDLLLKQILHSNNSIFNNDFISEHHHLQHCFHIKVIFLKTTDLHMCHHILI